MIQWRVENGQLQIMFQTKEDIVQFVATVVEPAAKQLGLEIKITEAPKKEVKKPITVRL
jgi:hypothetical protein